MKRRLWLRAVMAAILVFAGYSLARLFEFRFSSGDIYPPGSSRRADPKGAKALFQALELLPSIHVERNYQRLSRADLSAGTTVMLLGVSPAMVDFPLGSPAGNDTLDQFVRQGGRLVLAVRHESIEEATNVWNSGFRGLALARIDTNHATALGARLGFAVGVTNAAGERATRLSSADPVPASMPWPNGWYLTSLQPGWHSVFERGGQVVAATRTLGSGRIVLLASDYLLLNAALRDSRKALFISWLIGPGSHVVFEETHLGLTLQPGVAGLIRKYGLGGAVLGLALLAGLHLWRHGARFHPLPPPSADAGVLVGRESRDGFLNILRRTVPASDLSEVAFAEWRRSLGRNHSITAARLADAQEMLNHESALPPRQRNPAALYQRLTQLLRAR